MFRDGRRSQDDPGEGAASAAAPRSLRSGALGLGRPAGLGGALVAVLSYNTIQCALWGLFGFFSVNILNPRLGVDIAWYWWSFALMAVTAALGHFGIEISARVLGVLLILEVLVLLVLDVAVIFTGGASGLHFDSFNPAEIFSGAPGVTFVFAFATFVGFEATAIYGEETRDPKRTVPRATYVAVAIVTVFYALTSWSIVQAYGADEVVAAATRNPDGLFPDARANYVHPLSASLMEWLILTSIFAALLAFHNAAARYFYAMAREGLLPRRIARTHPRYGSPYRAGLLQAEVAFVVTLAFVLAGLDPYAGLFAWLSGIAALGIIGLQCLTSLSVIAFFRRTRLDARTWHTKAAPGLGALGLAAAMVFVVVNWDALTGASGGLVGSLWTAVPLLFACGVVWATVIRRRDAEAYERLGHFIDDSPDPACQQPEGST